MTLPAPSAVAFAISGGQTTDARELISVDLVGAPSGYRRGYAVMTEPLQPNGRGLELASRVRDTLLQELRAHPRQAPDAVLAHAFSIVNSLVFEEGASPSGIGQDELIGATAIVFEDHQATIAHVPPGQLILGQDGIVYTVPELDAWSPHWAQGPDAASPEPLGFAAWTSPLMLQMNLMHGDILMLTSANLGEALARHQHGAALQRLQAGSIWGRDPDLLLNDLKETALAVDSPMAWATVIGFPPEPTTSEIATAGDAIRNATEQWRRANAAVRAYLPARRPRPPVPAVPTPPPGPGAVPVAPADVITPTAAPKQRSLQSRLVALTEGRPADVWRPPDQRRLLGAPGTHGVSRFRRASVPVDEGGLRHAMPRVPFARSPWFIAFCLVVLIGVGALAWQNRDVFLPSSDDYDQYIADVDDRLLRADGLTDTAQILTELNAAQDALDSAKDAGAPDSVIAPRESRIVRITDEINNVYRLQNVTRIGGLPEILQQGETAAVTANGDLYLASGDLYRVETNPARMQLVLQQGQKVEGVTVGHIFSVAWDGRTLYATDGQAMFFAGTEGASWQAETLNDINDQGPWPAAQSAAFNSSFYLLEPEYSNIYRFDADATDTASDPYDWVLIGDRVGFDHAVDFSINANIYVLMDTGVIRVMERGAVIETIEVPTLVLKDETPRLLVGGNATGYLYVGIENDASHQMRFVAIDRQGGHVTPLMMPTNLSTGGADVIGPLQNVQDFTVDEDSGTIYIVNEDAVWSANYQLEPLASPDAATPTATP